MSFPSESQVLVVGAGPVGLVTAITLSSLGVQVAVVDSSPTNKNGSRAGIVHARTLEVLDTIGLATPIIDAGTRSNGIIVHGKGSEEIFDINMSRLKDQTKFPMSVLIPQFEVERILREKTISQGIQVFRGKTVIGMHKAGHAVDVTFKDESVVRTQYVVGTDGSHSTVRHLTGMEFKDPHTGADYDDPVGPSLQMIFADAYLEEPLPKSIPRDRLSIYLDNSLLLAPLRTIETIEQGKNSFWRVTFRMPAGGPEPPSNPSLEYLQEEMDKRNPWGTKVTISSVSASTRYRVRTAVASSYFQKMGEGNILLAGDAAHVHSPAGGQGMNLGICDAVTLGHAIHSHIEAKDSERDYGILLRYADQRRERAIAVINLAKDLTAIIGSRTGWRRRIRDLTLRFIGRVPYVSRLVAWKISGLANRIVFDN